MNTLTCLNCGHEIRHGDIDAMVDEFGYYCNDICADEYYEQKHGLDSIDWDDFDQKQEGDAETRDNYFNADVIAPCFVTNGKFAIYGDIKIPSAHAKGLYSYKHEANKINWLDQYDAAQDCELTQTSDDRYQICNPVISEYWYNKEYIDFCCNMLRTTPADAHPRLIDMDSHSECHPKLCMIKSDIGCAVIAPRF